MDIELGTMRVQKVFESTGAMPMPMVLPGVTASDMRTLKRWYWSDELNEDPAQALCTLSMHSYVLRVDGMTILIDSCNGNDKQRSVPLMNQLQTPYLSRLNALGLTPEDIDMVLCTHLHCDHVGWNTRLENGRWVPTFPNARYLFTRKDYEHFSSEHAEALHREAFADSVLPVVEAGLADLVENDHVVHREIGDGIWLEDAHGHSLGSVAIHAERGGDHALFSGDCFHHPIQLIRPDLTFFADEDPDQACVTRRALMEAHADQPTIFFPAHFGGASAGRIHRDGTHFRFAFIE